jgi:ABC-2 type transport system permease protein
MTGSRALVASFRLQLWIALRNPGEFMVLLTVPMLTGIFLSLSLAAGREQAVVNAVLAPGLIGLWFVALDLGASVVRHDRWNARLELLITSRSSLATVIFGRLLAAVCVGGLAFVESWLAAVLFFGVTVPLASPVVFAVALVATCFAAAGTATLIAGAFVLSRNLPLFHHVLTYPYYILGGVLVPVAFLPGWLGPVSEVVFLSWSADLLREAMSRPSVPDWGARTAVVLLLGAAALLAGYRLVGVVVERVRTTASAGYA